MYRLMTVSSATDIYYLLAVHLIFRFSQRIILDFLCPVHILAILEHVCDERPILFWKHSSTLASFVIQSASVSFHVSHAIGYEQQPCDLGS